MRRNTPELLSHHRWLQYFQVLQQTAAHNLSEIHKLQGQYSQNPAMNTVFYLRNNPML